GDLFVLRERDQVHDRLAARRATGLRQLVDLEPEEPAFGGENQYIRVRRGDEDLLDEVLVARRRARLAAAAAPLRAIEGDRIALHVALVAEGHHHVLFGDQVLGGKLAGFALDLGAARVGEERLHLAQL